jgi:regulator of sirC expression with transglutaminase-like and TPR domain
MSESMTMQSVDARRRFLEFAGGEITNENLALGALLIAAEDYPRLDVYGYVGQLDEIARRVMARSYPGEPAIMRLDHLHEELFGPGGFTGDSETYYDPRNGYINEAIDRRQGLPIILSIIYLHVASRCGLNVFGVGLPGHYIVKLQFELSEVYVDPFRSGETMTATDLAAVVTEMSGGSVRLSSNHLKAWSGRDTLMRVLANLQGMWQRAGDNRRAAAAAERLEILQG